jgi:hypothetical protein
MCIIVEIMECSGAENPPDVGGRNLPTIFLENPGVI